MSTGVTLEQLEELSKVPQTPNLTPNLNGFNLQEWFRLRQLARTNLYFLCKDVLGHRDIDLNVSGHCKIMEVLQHFHGGWEADHTTPENISLKRLRDGYRPKRYMWDLQHASRERRTLILVSRGFLKSSIATVGHKIQWVINYPDVRILLSSGTGDQVNKFMSGILQHFRFNDTFRWLFPEFCPWGKVDRFGSGNGMTTPARTSILNEPTFVTTSIGSAVAGGHYDVENHDDVVNEENVRTADSLELVKNHIRMTGPLLERKHGKPGWTDFEGTRYDYTDAYGEILDSEKKLPPEQRTYAIVFEPAGTGDWGTVLWDEKKQEWNPGNFKPQWPERYPIATLKAIENNPMEGPNVLASQYFLIPRPAKSGLIEHKREIVWTPVKVINELYASLRLHVTMDFHGMAPVTAQNARADNDYTAITLAGFGADGHCYILSVYHGRPTPFDIIDYLFMLWQHHPRIIDMKAQKDHLTHMLLPFLQKEQMRRQKFLPIYPSPINNQISKKNKIRALQGWFKGGVLSFSEAIQCRFHLEEEIIRFPKFHDDILDTIRDQMENRDGSVMGDALGGRQQAQQLESEKQRGLIPGSSPSFHGFGPDGAEIWTGIKEEMEPQFVDPITGL